MLVAEARSIRLPFPEWLEIIEVWIPEEGRMPRLICLVALLICAPCAGGQGLARVPQSPFAPPPSHSPRQLAPQPAAGFSDQLNLLQPVVCQGEKYDEQLIEQDSGPPVLRAVRPEPQQLAIAAPTPLAAEPLADGPVAAEPPADIPAVAEPPADVQPVAQPPAVLPPVADNILQLNLPTALAMIGGQHPVVGFAQWRVKEAYAELQQARVLWLPSIQAGMSYDRHDGNLQASDGKIVDVNRGSLQYGLGTGAVGAGTTQRPGIVTEFHLADAIFQPKIAEKQAWAQSHAAQATLNRQLRDAAIAYTDLINAHQQKSVLDQARQRTSELAKLTRDFAETGQGLQADADRLQTELMLMDNRVVASAEQVAVASASLAQTLNTDPMSQLMPLDPTVVPINMVAAGTDKTTLITTGLSNRPELKQARTLVAAACDAYKQQKYAPYIPSVLLGFSAGGFGGGLGSDIDNVQSRYDFDALVSWRVRNLGFGEQASRQASNARVQQQKFANIRLMDQVAQEIAAAHAQVEHRRQQVTITRAAIESAENSYQRNLSRIRDGQGLPLEVLQSARALEQTQLAYLNAVVDFNTAQFRLQWALGWPITAAAKD
jgi:outer membrane protein TolC